MKPKTQKNMRRILIVEDTDVNYLLLEEFLSGYNVELTRAIDGKEFFDKITKPANYDLILMDMLLPDTNGITLTKFLLRENYNIPIIFISAITDKRKEIFDLGIKCFIEKPVCEDNFIDSINKYFSLEKVEGYS